MAGAEDADVRLVAEERADRAMAGVGVEAVLRHRELEADTKPLDRETGEDGVAGEERAGRLVEKKHRAFGVSRDLDRGEAPTALRTVEGLVHLRARRVAIFDHAEQAVNVRRTASREWLTRHVLLEDRSVVRVSHDRSAEAVAEESRVTRVIRVAVSEEDGGEVTWASYTRTSQVGDETTALRAMARVDQKAAPLRVLEEPGVRDANGAKRVNG